jgi:hypothetical protein
MMCVRRPVSALVAALILALLCATAQAAPPSITVSIFGDYSMDHVINGTYTASELQQALAAAKGQGTPFKQFESAVQDVYDREFLGLHTGNGNGQTAQEAATPSTLLPEPRGPGERDQPPWPFLAMTVLAGALVVTGAGSSIYRRVHR